MRSLCKERSPDKAKVPSDTGSARLGSARLSPDARAPHLGLAPSHWLVGDGPALQHSFQTTVALQQGNLLLVPAYDETAHICTPVYEANWDQSLSTGSPCHSWLPSHLALLLLSTNSTGSPKHLAHNESLTTNAGRIGLGCGGLVPRQKAAAAAEAASLLPSDHKISWPMSPVRGRSRSCPVSCVHVSGSGSRPSFLPRAAAGTHSETLSRALPSGAAFAVQPERSLFMSAGPNRRRASRATSASSEPRAARRSVLFLVALCRCATAGCAAHLGTGTRADAESAYVSSAVTRPGERALLSVATDGTLPYSYEPSSSGSSAREGVVNGVLRDGNASASFGPSHAATDSQRVATRDSRSGLYETDFHNATGTYETGRGGSVPSTQLDDVNGTSASSSTSLLSESGRESTPAPMGLPRVTDDGEGVGLPKESSDKHGWTPAPPLFRDVTAAVNTSHAEVLFSRQSVTTAVKEPPNSPGLRSTVPTATMQGTQFTSRVTVLSPVSTPIHAVPSTAAPQTQLSPSTAPRDYRVTTGLESTTRASQQVVPSRTEQTDRGGVTMSEVQTSSAVLGSTARPPHHTAVPFTSTNPVRRTVPDAARNTTDRRDRVRTASTQIPITSAAEPENACDPLTCANGGTCVNGGDGSRRCICLPLWTGHDCTVDVDECVSAPCPRDSRCENTRGSFACECPLGYSLENGRTCTQVKTFLGTFRASGVDLNSTLFSSGGLHEVQREVLQLVNASLSNMRGYIRSTLSKSFGDGEHISVVNTFSMAAEVTGDSVFESIQMFLNSCSPLVTHCSGILRHKLLYRAESLCAALMTQCDRQRSECTDTNGTIFCQCRSGYFKLSTNDLSCRECDDGFKLENGTCVRCTFGFGGFNCGNFYKLIAVVVSPAGGAVLLIVIIALIIACCRKGKNDINKIIFKSGDFQMTPYGDYPKSNRVSVEWGKETIELQENGSTKNLLQMTDIYYSPPLRNPEMERHALYPFSGLPGSRHSCIYPAQWNPSFISDDTRRRDYF